MVIHLCPRTTYTLKGTGGNRAHQPPASGCADLVQREGKAALGAEACLTWQALSFKS